MTSQNGFDRTLSDWLAAESAPDVPDRVYEGAFAEVRTTGQFRPMADALTRWLRPRDTLPGPRPGHGCASNGQLRHARDPCRRTPHRRAGLGCTPRRSVAAVARPPVHDRRVPRCRLDQRPGRRRARTLTAVPDGRALVTNGPKLDVFDPATGQFVSLGQPPLGVTTGREATLLQDGTVLIVGGGAADRAVP